MHPDGTKGRGARTARVTNSDVPRCGTSEQDAFAAWSVRIDAQAAMSAQVRGVVAGNCRCRCSVCRWKCVWG